ncbi:hypothetical protein ACFVT1_13375 [Streptomyces sp. NPDC057963]|uniref:hypothetical protein n=1 Tax=Streptomyces sp. NPDC057963 TaxID=3346290 RepID=UPI0036F151F7
MSVRDAFKARSAVRSDCRPELAPRTVRGTEAASAPWNRSNCSGSTARWCAATSYARRRTVVLRRKRVAGGTGPVLDLHGHGGSIADNSTIRLSREHDLHDLHGRHGLLALDDLKNTPLAARRHRGIPNLDVAPPATNQQLTAGLDASTDKLRNRALR